MTLPLDALIGPDETCDALSPDFRLLQLRKGHRFSTDDLVTSWRATTAKPNATRLLDLGSGIGSVGFGALALLQHKASLVGIEAQDVSFDLAQRSVLLNGVQDRVRYVFGDIRDPEVLPAGSSFELITGSPPYMPPGTGILSPIPQRAACRHELRGSVFDYCEAARRWLEPEGRFCFVMPTADERNLRAIEAHGFVLLERFAIHFRAGVPPLISTFLCARREDIEPCAPQEGALHVRGDDGEWTDEYFAFRALFGVEDPRSKSQ